MVYEKKEWKNRVVEKPMTFVAMSNLDGTVTLQPKEGNVAEEGTPVDAENMNRIEQGIDYIDKNIGDIVNLKTTDKTSIVNALNETKSSIEKLLGEFKILTTKDKTNLVNAINEVLKTAMDCDSNIVKLVNTKESGLQSSINSIQNQVNQPTRIPTSQPALQEGSIWIS